MNKYQIRALCREIVARELVALVQKMWTIQDVVRHLQCDESTLRRRKAEWKFPAPDIHEGRFMRWYPSTVLNWKKPQ